MCCLDCVDVAFGTHALVLKRSGARIVPECWPNEPSAPRPVQLPRGQVKATAGICRLAVVDRAGICSRCDRQLLGDGAWPGWDRRCRSDPDVLDVVLLCRDESPDGDDGHVDAQEILLGQIGSEWFRYPAPV